MLPTGDGDQPFADSFRCRDHFLMTGQLSLCFIDLILDLLAGVIIQFFAIQKFVRPAAGAVEGQK